MIIRKFNNQIEYKVIKIHNLNNKVHNNLKHNHFLQTWQV